MIVDLVGEGLHPCWKTDDLLYFLFDLWKKATKLRIADFVHGKDGLGNQNFPPPKGKCIQQHAPEFLVEQAKLHPGNVTVVALGPLTNIALVEFFLAKVHKSKSYLLHLVWMMLFIHKQALQLDPEFSKNIGQIVLLGGAFSVNGNVNPAAEANVWI